jgi:hypothetical protein
MMMFECVRVSAPDSMRMQCRRARENHIGPKSFSLALPHPPTPFPFPLNRPAWGMGCDTALGDSGFGISMSGWMIFGELSGVGSMMG